ncbi:unnamed protein product, partial [Urochloa humidicola]
IHRGEGERSQGSTPPPPFVPIPIPIRSALRSRWPTAAAARSWRSILLPPLGVFLRFGCCRMEFCICLLLTILGYIPGMIYAIYVLVALDSDRHEREYLYPCLAHSVVSGLNLYGAQLSRISIFMWIVWHGITGNG